MAYLQSPGIQIIEKDVSGVTRGLSTTVGAYAGAFRWGPVLHPMLISTEAELAATFGQPSNTKWAHFFSAANFLGYTNAMWVNRAVETGMANAVVDGTSTTLIKNIDDYNDNFSTGISTVGEFAARYPGELGSGLKVSLADAGTFGFWEYRSQFSTIPGTSESVSKQGGSNDELHMVIIDSLGKFSGTPGTILEKYSYVSKASDAISWEGQNNHYASVLANKSAYVYWLEHPALGTNWGNTSANTAFVSLSTTDTITATSAACVGTVATITYATTTTPRFAVGESIVVSGFTPAAYNGTFTVTACTATTVVFTVSETIAASSVAGVVNTTLASAYDFTFTLTGGKDATDSATLVTDAQLQTAWITFADTQTYDISLVIAGNASIALSAWLVHNIGDVRKDCVVFTSITESLTGLATPIFAANTNRIAAAKLFKTFDSTYAVIDSGYKYMYDRYNDKYRWIALNSDTAGLCARVDATNDPWFSPAGMVKGQVKNAIKLSWNPTLTERDQLYPAAINPIINQVGQGTILYGDKTATTKPSAFGQINVRRLFLILEKSIANSAKYQLFELNDEVTRLQFVASVEPFLRDVAGRRGISAYKVICDTTNNTPQVIASNNFVGTILVRANYSVNFITLNFVAVGPSVEFSVAAGA